MLVGSRLDSSSSSSLSICLLPPACPPLPVAVAVAVPGRRRSVTSGGTSSTPRAAASVGRVPAKKTAEDREDRRGFYGSDQGLGPSSLYKTLSSSLNTPCLASSILLSPCRLPRLLLLTLYPGLVPIIPRAPPSYNSLYIRPPAPSSTHKAHFTMRLLLHLSWATVAFSLSGNVKGTVYMPDLKIEEERVEDGEGLKLPCATSVYTSNGSYSKWGKVWRVNGTESFDASRVTFINDNATLRIQSLHPVDHGVYECCLHAYAYEDYLCFVTKLILGDGNANWGETAVEVGENTTAAPPAWNVDLTGMDTLNALPNSTYFIRLFDANVTDIKCIKDGNETESLKTGNDFPNPLFTDALISTFNAALHQGMYFCNGTYHDGNQTEILHVEFEVIESIDSNLHTQLLDGELVKEYRNSQHRSLIDMALILVLFYNLCR